MGKLKKKGNSGAAVAFLTKKQACKKLQLTLGQFRKFCILKGIFPREVKKHPRGKDKTYFYFKDVNFLLHDPLLQVFRERSAIKKKIVKAKAKGETGQVERLKVLMPEYNLDHIIKERYPTFVDALRDLDDAISMIYLFASLRSSNFVPVERVQVCERICREFEAYIVKTRSLTKVFVSIKGVYYQAEVFGQKLTWLVPHGINQMVTKNVDYKVMLTFLELYETLMGFVLFRLYNSIGLSYPTKPQETKEGDGALDMLLKELEKAHPTLQEVESKEKSKEDELTKKAKQKMATVDTKMLIDYDKKQQAAHDNQHKEKEQTPSENMELDDEFFKQQKEEERFKKLFEGKKLFLSREVPRNSLEFVIRCFGGTVSWDGPDAPFPEKDESITHQIVDRSFQKHQYLSRVYVQPQWVFDSVNERILLPSSEYGPTSTLPAHLSPFVDDEKEGYKPKRREQLEKIKTALETGESLWEEGNDNSESEDEEVKELDLEEKYKSELKAEMEGKSFEEVQKEQMEEEKPKKKKNAGGQKRKKEDEEKEQLGSEMMLSKKKRWLYNRINEKIQHQKDKSELLMSKRRKIEEEEKKKKTEPKQKQKQEPVAVAPPAKQSKAASKPTPKSTKKAKK